MPLQFKCPEGVRCLFLLSAAAKTTLHSLLRLIIHSNHSSTSGENEWQQLKMETTNKRRCRWWHPPHQESLHRKESMSDQRSIPFLRCIFCDVWEFYALQWPMLCTVSKTKHGRVHRKNNLPPLPHQHFFQAVFDAWWRIVWSGEGECVWYIQGQLDFTICCVRYFCSRPANKHMLWGISSAGARQKEKKKTASQQAFLGCVESGRMCSLNYYTSAAAFNKEWLKLRAW